MSLRNLQTTIDKAERLYAKGKYQSALDTYEGIRGFARNEPKILLRLGDITRRIGKKDIAIENYREAARAYVQQGFIVKAIAVTKVILKLDPSREDIESNLAALYLKKDDVQSQSLVDSYSTPNFPKTIKMQPPDSVDDEMADIELVPVSDDPVLKRTPLFSDLDSDELTGIIKKLKFTVCP